jgi:hypothetical protein
MKSRHAITPVLFIGICLCLICALYPPRSITNTSSVQFDNSGGKFTPFKVTHAFLFAPDFGIYHGPNGWVFPATVDGGRLLAELVLIASLTGILIFMIRFIDSAPVPELEIK